MLDIIVILLVLIFAVFGYKKGLIKSMIGVISLIASVALAWSLYPIVSDLFTFFGVKEKIFDSIHTTLLGYMGTDIQNVPQMFRYAIETGSSAVAFETANAISGIVLNIISFISVLIVSRILIWIGAKLLNCLSKLPVINFFNKSAGLVLGAAEGILVVYLMLTVIYAIEPIKTNEKISSAMETSIIAGEMYDNNPIINIFKVDEKTETGE